MSRLIGLFFAFVSFSTWALVPVEGIILGEANRAYQNDPLAYIFRDRTDVVEDDQYRKAKFYSHALDRGLELRESCNYLKPSSYPQKWMETQAKRSFISTLQYLGLDFSIKAIGSYARTLDVTEDGYKTLTKNLVQNYCSKNITVFSLKKIEKALADAYSNSSDEHIPSLALSPYVSRDVKSKTEGIETRKKEMEYAIKNFRAFCSWGGSVDDYRLLTPYLKNPFIMAFVIEQMSGLKSTFDDKTKKIVTKPDPSTAQVSCRELICRESTPQEFDANFPRSGGSTGVNTDLKKLYCNSYRDLEFRAKATLPEVRAWVKNVDEEKFIFETNHFLSLVTGVSDIFFGIENYQEVMPLVKSFTLERWDSWANSLLASFSQNLLYEESLKVKAIVRDDYTVRERKAFAMDFSVTMGELDKIMDNEKLKLSFNLKITKNFLRHMRYRWNELAQKSDLDGQGPLKEEFARFINVQLKQKEDLLRQPLWNEQFGTLIVDELMRRLISYEGRFFDSYEDEMLDVPVRFKFGSLALGYIRYRSDVRAQRLKLNL